MNIRLISVTNATLIVSAVTLAVALFGSPFDGGVLNLKSPTIVISEAAVSEGPSFFYRASKDGFDVSFRLVNASSTAANVNIGLAAWGDKEQPLSSVLPEIGPDIILLEPTQATNWLERYSEFPATLVLCFSAETVKGFGRKKVFAVYQTLRGSGLLPLRRSSKKPSSEQSKVCQAQLINQP